MGSDRARPPLGLPRPPARPFLRPLLASYQVGGERRRGASDAPRSPPNPPPGAVRLRRPPPSRLRVVIDAWGLSPAPGPRQCLAHMTPGAGDPGAGVVRRAAGARHHDRGL